MIDLNKKTYRNILQAQLDRVPNSLDKREGSMIQTALGAGAYSLEEFYLELDQVQRGAYLQTAVGQDLEYLAVLANVRRYGWACLILTSPSAPDSPPSTARTASTLLPQKRSPVAASR